MKIPVVVVDDEQIDRYTVRRRLDKHGAFEKVQEAVSGDAFLELYCGGSIGSNDPDVPLLVLMDINMPGRNGFETVAELEERQNRGQAGQSVVAMMFTSSASPTDKQQADTIPLVRGYFEKPMSAVGAQMVHDIYVQACTAQSGNSSSRRITRTGS